MLLYFLQRIIAIAGKNKLILLLSYFLTELLLDKHFEISLIISNQNFCHDAIILSFSFNKGKSTGLVKKSSAPNRLAVLKFSSSPYAVIIITTGGGLRYLPFIFSSNSSPFMPGMLISDNIKTTSCSCSL